MKRRNSSSAGFTIIELMVVVAIAAILAMVAAPSFTEFLSKRRVEGAMSELLTDLHFARSEAVSRNAVVRMTFIGTDCYVIHLASAAATACNTVAPPAAEIKSVRIDAARLSLNATSMTFIEFDPVRGTAANDLTTPGNGRVNVVANAPGTQWRLQAVVTLMGRVETCSPSGTGHVAGYSTACS